MNKREKVFKKTNGKCIYCGSDLDFYNFHVEHMKPKSKLIYNKSDIKNLFPSCIDCNLLKGNLEVEEFREKIENFIFEDTRCRTLARYYNLKPKNITFYFERKKGGD
jgi:uncharacterized protein (TIGR02646 family)